MTWWYLPRGLVRYSVISMSFIANNIIWKFDLLLARSPLLRSFLHTMSTVLYFIVEWGSADDLENRGIDAEAETRCNNPFNAMGTLCWVCKKPSHVLNSVCTSIFLSRMRIGKDNNTQRYPNSILFHARENRNDRFDHDTNQYDLQEVGVKWHDVEGRGGQSTL